MKGADDVERAKKNHLAGIARTVTAWEWDRATLPYSTAEAGDFVGVGSVAVRIDNSVRRSGDVMMPRVGTFVWRGMLGGIIGYLIETLFSLYRAPYLRMYVGGFLFFLWVPLAYGAAVGFALWMIERETSQRINMIGRLIAGVALASLLGSPYMYLLEHRMPILNPNEIKWLALDLILLGPVIGLPTALLVLFGRDTDR